MNALRSAVCLHYHARVLLRLYARAQIAEVIQYTLSLCRCLTLSVVALSAVTMSVVMSAVMMSAAMMLAVIMCPVGLLLCLLS